MTRLIKMLLILQTLTVISMFMQSCSRPAYAWGDPSISSSALRMAQALERIATSLERGSK